MLMRTNYSTTATKKRPSRKIEVILTDQTQERIKTAFEYSRNNPWISRIEIPFKDFYLHTHTEDHETEVAWGNLCIESAHDSMPDFEFIEFAFASEPKTTVHAH